VPDASLEQHIAEHPDDEKALLVLADQLAEAGDPSGELGQVQHRLGSQTLEATARAALEARERVLVAECLGSLAIRDLVDVDFHLGLVRGARFGQQLRYGLPFGEAELATQLLGRRCARFVQALSFDDLRLGDVSEVLAARSLPALRHLALLRNRAEAPIELDRLEALPRLERLILGSRAVGFAALPSSLRALEFRGRGLPPPVESIGAQRSLHTLVLTMPRSPEQVDALIEHISTLRESLRYFGVLGIAEESIPARVLRALGATSIATLEVWNADESLAEWIAHGAPPSLRNLVHWTPRAVLGVHREPRVAGKFWMTAAKLPFHRQKH